MSRATNCCRPRAISRRVRLPVDGHRTLTARSGAPACSIEKELEQLTRDPAGVPAVRTALESISISSMPKPSTAASHSGELARVATPRIQLLQGTDRFARCRDHLWTIRDGLAIDIARIAEKRPKNSSGLYDSNGQVNVLLADYLTAFREHASGGVITQDEALAILDRKASLGTVSKRQFKSLFGCAPC